MMYIYAVIAVGSGLLLGIIPLRKGVHVVPDLIDYVDSRTELQKQDPKLTLELENWIKGGCRR